MNIFKSIYSFAVTRNLIVKRTIIFTCFFSALLSFQNCGQKFTSDQSVSAVASTSGANSTSTRHTSDTTTTNSAPPTGANNNGGTVTPPRGLSNSTSGTNAGSSGSQPTGGSAHTGSTPTGSTPAGSTPAGSTPAGSTPTGSTPTGSTTSRASNGPSQEATENCDSMFNKFGWKSPSEPLQVDLGTGYRVTEWAQGNKIVTAGFNLHFIGPVRPQASLDEGIVSRFNAVGFGLSLSFKDKTTGATFASLSESELLPSDEYGFPSPIRMSSSNTDRSKRTSLQLTIPRRIFVAARNYSAVDVEIICSGQKVTSSQQDFRVLDYRMLSEYIPSTSGTESITSPGSTEQIMVERRAPAGLYFLQTELNCPSKLAFGESGSCRVENYDVSSITWFVNGVQLAGADNVNPITTPGAQRGLHTIQALIRTKDGSLGRSQIKTIFVP